MTHSTREALDAAMNDANRGHRPHEWERVATDLMVAAAAYTKHVDEKRAEWERPVAVLKPGSNVGLAKGDLNDPAVYVAAAVDNTAVATPYAMRLVDHVLQEWLTLHLQKNRKYAKVSNDLGAKGVYPDVNRKVGILKDRVWDGHESTGEPTAEVIDDLIGHLFLMRDFLVQEANPQPIPRLPLSQGLVCKCENLPSGHLITEPHPS